jgi:uncharacterized protein (TIGR02145 family)
LALFVSALSAKAQVHIGSMDEPKATLEVTGKDTDATAPGIIAPRLTLTELNAAQAKYTVAQKGAFVYIYDYQGSTITGYSDQVGCVGYYWFDGAKWNGNCGVTPDWIHKSLEVKAFTFYEDLTSGTVAPLTFSASGSGTIEYQWFRIMGSNVHVRVATKINSPTGNGNGTGYTTGSFIPNPKVSSGNTRNAANCGFYRFFCRAYNEVGGIVVDSIESQVAEIAVGCGAKNIQGEWLSFLCFNLGATTLTINDQKTSLNITPATVNDVNGKHYYKAGEENVYGDLYQWGRIGDGHEKRGITVFNDGDYNVAGSNAKAYVPGTPPTYTSGNIVGTSQRYPDSQVSPSDANGYYGKFIYHNSSTNSYQDYNWAYAIASTSTKDQLWRSGRYVANDPCTKIKSDGLTYATYYLAAAPTSTGEEDGGTGWRLPIQDEWGTLYKGGAISGSPSIALANSWVWYSNATTGVRGYDVRPDASTTTMFLPASGIRSNGNGLLYYQGTRGYYWSSTFAGTNAYYLSFGSGSVNPANIGHRSHGFALRCIRN